MALSENKIYGIPSIITGKDNISALKGGVINVNNVDPKIIVNEYIKIWKDFDYRKKFGKITQENEVTVKNGLNWF